MTVQYACGLSLFSVNLWKCDIFHNKPSYIILVIIFYSDGISHVRRTHVPQFQNLM